MHYLLSEDNRSLTYSARGARRRADLEVMAAGRKSYIGARLFNPNHDDSHGDDSLFSRLDLEGCSHLGY